ncbi:MAG TPA: hypothetical protein VFE24_01040 [Pirellulales bacterium]|jgi:hypothetical protein|nr:hypothetical protein [Pirellulales bacterium]
MKFIELNGKTLRLVINDQEVSPEDLHNAGVDDDSIVRINEQGDIELRRRDRWDVIGGLLGDFYHRLRKVTHLDWAGDD